MAVRPLVVALRHVSHAHLFCRGKDRGGKMPVAGRSPGPGLQATGRLAVHRLLGFAAPSTNLRDFARRGGRLG